MTTATPPPAARSALRVALVSALLAMALTVAAKSVRDALFCEHFSITELPRVMVAGALLSGLLALIAARVFRVIGPVRGVVGLLLVNALGLLLEHASLRVAPRPTALVLYLHVSAVGAVLVSGFWSIVNERFDPHTLRLVVSRIGLGGAAGGLVGGFTAERVTAWAGVRHTLLSLVAFSVMAALALLLLSRKGPENAPLQATRVPGPPRSAYVRQIAVFVGLSALASSMTDFAFKARAMEHYASAESLVRFFALFYMAVSAVSFAVQSFVTPPLLEKVGLGAGLTGLPGAAAISGLLALAVPGLPTQALLKGVDASLTSSLFRSAYELLYTPLSTERKRPVKALVDVVVDKLGDGFGSALSWGLVWLLPNSAARGASFVVMVLSLITFAVAGRLYQRYVEELAESLRSRSVVIDEADVHDNTTRLTLSRTMGSMTRERLLTEIRKRVEEAKPAVEAVPLPAISGGADLPPSRQGRPAAMATPRLSELSNSIADLLSENAERIRRALDAPDPQLAPFVIPLLSRQDVGARAMAVLGAFGTRVTGQLADALLDTERFSPAVRRRLARILARGRSAWAASALLAALDDPDYDVRSQVLEGLDEIRRHGVKLPVTRETMVAAAIRELARTDCPPSRRRVEHPLALLGLAFDPEAFRLAAKALASDDQNLRGTALEYLENVLPDAVRSRLFATLPVESRSKSQRVERELLADLRRRLG